MWNPEDVVDIYASLFRNMQGTGPYNELDLNGYAADAASSDPAVAVAAQHLHGGIGLDLDYPVHRYFRWAKELELRLGEGWQGFTENLDDLSVSSRTDPLTSLQVANLQAGICSWIVL